MILDETNKLHQKHAKLARPVVGDFGRNELAIVGTTCANIKSLATKIIGQLTSYKVAYVDADHKPAVNEEANTTLANGEFLEYTDKITFQRFDFKNGINAYQKRTIFNEQDLILINGNHFTGRSQIVVIDPVKNLEKKIEQLTDVQVFLVKDGGSTIPEFLRKLHGFNEIPTLSLEDENGINAFVRQFVEKRIPVLNGLVLSGGNSTRMKRDKGSLSYHGINQRHYLHGLLSKYCQQVFVSCNAEQAKEVGGQLPVLQDTFLNLGPVGGILSAFQTDPNASWLSIACDLPYLSEKTIEYLIKNRNPAKNATAFLDPEGIFPEPLIAIWEPKSYSVLLQFLSLGYSCPRKVLINSDIELLKAPDEKEFLNANLPEEYEKALKELKSVS